MKEKFTKREKSWIMYDWANSVYATIMMAAVYPIYFTGYVNGQGEMGDYWWGIGTSVCMAVMALLAPIVGAVADYRGHKKKLFVAFLVLGLSCTLFSAFTDIWQLMLVGYGLSHIGFSGSNLVYDSFLTDVTTPERMDRVSGYGYAFGYIGGSTIPFLVSIALIQFGSSFGIDGAMAVKISLIITVLWWGGFSIPFIRNIKQRHWVEKPKTGVVKETFKAIGRTAKKIVGYKGVFFFILAYFFYIDGVGTIINMSTSYGETLGLGQVSMILALLVTQIVAFPCSILFSRLSKRYGSLRMLFCAVCVYLVICVVGFVMGMNVELAEGRGKTAALEELGLSTALATQPEELDAALVAADISQETWYEAWHNQPTVDTAIGQSTVLFWVLATMVGTVQGGIQATSRAHYAKIVPPENSGEFFGFFDIFGKFASVLGPALYAFTRGLTDSSAAAILSIILLFAVALVLFAVGGKHMHAAEQAAYTAPAAEASEG